jgi:hypothetical protein
MDRDPHREGSTPPAPASTEGDARRPQHFFDQPWQGTAVTCDAFGLPRDRAELSYNPHRASDGSTLIDHRVVYESGVVNTFQWRILPSRGEQVAARDQLSGREARGCLTREGFRWSFQCLHKTAFGVRRCRTEVIYTRLSPTDGETSVTITFLGVTVGTAAGRLRRVQAEVKAA